MTLMTPAQLASWEDAALTLMTDALITYRDSLKTNAPRADQERAWDIYKSAAAAYDTARAHTGEAHHQAAFTRKNIFDGLHELYQDHCKLKAEQEGITRFRYPDYELMLDQLERDGIPPA